MRGRHVFATCMTTLSLHKAWLRELLSNANASRVFMQNFCTAAGSHALLQPGAHTHPDPRQQILPRSFHRTEPPNRIAREAQQWVASCRREDTASQAVTLAQAGAMSSVRRGVDPAPSSQPVAAWLAPLWLVPAAYSVQPSKTVKIVWSAMLVMLQEDQLCSQLREGPLASRRLVWRREVWGVRDENVHGGVRRFDLSPRCSSRRCCTARCRPRSRRCPPQSPTPLCECPAGTTGSAPRKRVART
jgi:hypothetical protein